METKFRSGIRSHSVQGNEFRLVSSKGVVYTWPISRSQAEQITHQSTWQEIISLLGEPNNRRSR